MLLVSGLAVVIVYLVLSINVYLEAFAFGTFSLGYGRLGPTEGRIALIAINFALALGAGLDFRFEGVGVTLLDVAVLGVAGLMGALLLTRTARNLRQLAAQEPSARPTGVLRSAAPRG
jgi:hypothetical protein